MRSMATLTTSKASIVGRSSHKPSLKRPQMNLKTKKKTQNQTEKVATILVAKAALVDPVERVALEAVAAQADLLAQTKELALNQSKSNPSLK